MGLSERDDDNDGLPNAYEESMYLFNGVKIITERNNADTDGDGLYDNSARAVVQNGKIIVVATKDPDSTKVNGPKGMWDAHVKACKNKGAATEYAEYEDYEEEWEEAEEILHDFIKEAIVANERSKYRVVALMMCSYGISLPSIIFDKYIENEAEEKAEEIKDYKLAHIC